MDSRRDQPEEGPRYEESAPSAEWAQAEVQQDSHELPQEEDNAPPPSAVKQDWSNPYDLSSFGGGTVSYSASYSLDTFGSSTPAHSASPWSFDDHRPTSVSYGIPDDGNQKKDARYNFSDDAPPTHHAYGMPEMNNHTSSFSYSFDDDSSRSAYSYNINLDDNDSNASQGYSFYDSSDRYDNDRAADAADNDNDPDTDTDQSNDEAVDGGEGIGLLFSAKQTTREDPALRPSTNASNASRKDKAKPAPASNGKQQARVLTVQANKAPVDREAKKRLKYEARQAKREAFKRHQRELKRAANLPANGPYADECDSW